jgi:hypothetical protein
MEHNMDSTLANETELRDSVAPKPQDIGDLADYINSLTDRKHDYGTCVYAMSLSAVAAFNYVAHKLGVTGFQASCADLDIVRRTRHMEGPFMLIKAEDALYPQGDLHEKLDEVLPKWTDWLGEEAAKKLHEKGTAHPAVLRHWLKLAVAAGKNGFDANEIEAKATFLENEFTLSFIEENASQFKRFGLNDIYVRGGEVARATSCKEGGAWRNNKPVSLQFGATINGIKAHWFVDTEREGSNGKAETCIDFALLKKMKSQAKGPVKKAITEYIAKVSQPDSENAPSVPDGNDSSGAGSVSKEKE